MATQAAFRLPRFTAAVDCAPLGYPGLEVHFWLNMTYDPDRVEDEAWRKENSLPKNEPRTPVWESDFYYGLGRMIEKVVVPAEYSPSGEVEEHEIADGHDLYDLLHTPGFEQHIATWASTHYYVLRQGRLEDALKNSGAASGGRVIESENKSR